MVIVKSTTACVLLVLLCTAWLSNARLHPSGAGANGISATKASIVTDDAINSNRILVALDDEKNLKKPSVKKHVVRKCGINAKSSSQISSVEIIKRSLKTRFSDEVDSGLGAFTADYHSPRHHPPKNNK